MFLIADLAWKDEAQNLLFILTCILKLWEECIHWLNNKGDWCIQEQSSSMKSSLRGKGHVKSKLVLNYNT